MRDVWKLVGSSLLGAAIGGNVAKRLWLAKYQKQAERLVSAESEANLLYTWLLLEERGISLTEFFEAKGHQKLAILGMGRIGRRFFDAVQKEKGRISVEYGIEAETQGAVHEKLTVYRLKDDPLPSADCVVICDLEWGPEKLAAVQREFSGEAVTLVQVLAWLLERHHLQSRDGAINGWPPD